MANFLETKKKSATDQCKHEQIEPSYRKIPVCFYQNPDTIKLAKDLLGKYLFTNFQGKITGGKIVETEAYHGIQDRASHSFSGKKTKRNQAMYEQGGIAYIYLCYGMHHLFNIVTGYKNDPKAVLIRAIEPICGLETMLKRRKHKTVSFTLTAGPGSLAQALGLNLKHNKTTLTGFKIWLEDPLNNPRLQITASSRVGVAYAKEDALLPWRFRIKNSPWCSKAR